MSWSWHTRPRSVSLLTGENFFSTVLHTAGGRADMIVLFVCLRGEIRSSPSYVWLCLEKSRDGRGKRNVRGPQAGVVLSSFLFICY
jgi:hypothetical protein